MQTELSTLLRESLAHSIVTFTYFKVDGTIRKAIGTRNLDLARLKTGANIPTPKGEEQPNSYYDIEKMGWRSYRPENLISIDELSRPKETPIVKRSIPISTPTAKQEKTTDRDPIEFVGGIIGRMFGDAPLHTAEPVTPTTKRGELPKREPNPICVGTPVFTERGLELPAQGITIDDFARLIAKYVADELVTRLKR